MKENPLPVSRRRAFSLPEVTISMGIVAVLMLPALAMLAGGGAMETLARDRETSSRIARAVVSGARGGEGGGHYLVDFSGGESIRIDSPGNGVEKTSYVLFDEKGLFLGEVGEVEYVRGVDPAGGGRYFLRLSLFGSDAGDGFAAWVLSVEQPAAAASASRKAVIFQTRLAIP